MAFGGFTNQSLGKIVSPDYLDLVSALTLGPVNRIDNRILAARVQIMPSTTSRIFHQTS